MTVASLVAPLVVLLAGAGPPDAPTASDTLDALFRADGAPFQVPAGIETVTFAEGTLTVSPAASLFRHPASVPVTLRAERADVVVWGCVDWLCAVRNEVIVPAGEARIADLPVWGGSAQLRARAVASGPGELACCRGPDRPVSAVLVPGAARGAAVVEVGPGAAIAFEGIGDLFDVRPDLVEAAAAVLVVEGVSTVPAAARAALLRRGGAWVTLQRDATSDTVAVVSARTEAHGQVVTLRGPVDGRSVARALAEALPALALPPADAHLPVHAVVGDAASVALAAGPPPFALIAVVLAAFVSGGVAVWRGRRAAWRRTLLLSTVLYASGGALVLLAKPVFVPEIVRARLVAWLGPDGITEVGVDAARPRSGAREVELTAPVAPLGLAVVANPGLGRAAVAIDDTGHARALAHADAGLALYWQRENPEAGKVRARNGALVNDLDDAVALVINADASRVAGPIAAHSAQNEATPVVLRGMSAWESLAPHGIAAHEERLLRAVAQRCANQGVVGCGAALVRRPDETVVVEVRGW